MKNYIITSNEYEIVTRRLKRLYDRKKRLKTDITNCTSKLKDIVVSSSLNNDKMINYVAALEEVEGEIKQLEKEALDLKDDLDYMNNRLSNINEIKEQIFVMYYIKGLEPKHIAPKIPCDISTVYKKIKEINKERKVAKKSQKYSYIIVL